MTATGTIQNNVTGTSRPRSNWWRQWGEETVAAYLFILPAMVILLVFAFFPVIFSVVTSLMKWNLPYQPSWIGLQNYQYLFQNPVGWKVFRGALLNTFYFTAGSVPLNMAISLFIALFLNQKLRGVGLFRTAYFLPTITSTVAVSAKSGSSGRNAIDWMIKGTRPAYGVINRIAAPLFMVTASGSPAMTCSSVDAIRRNSGGNFTG